MVNQKVCKKVSFMGGGGRGRETGRGVYVVDRKKSITRDHCNQHISASLVMPISDPRDRIFYPHHIPMKDTYNPPYTIVFSCTSECGMIVNKS